MSLIEVDGDLLSFNVKYIVHQTNCVSRGASGLAYHLFNKYPETNVYAEREKWNCFHRPGEVYVRPTNDGKYVINAMGQVNGGGPSEGDNIAISTGVYASDTAKSREKYFSNCLCRIYMIKNLESIAFPYGIGCNIAKGAWSSYFEMINKFADDISDPDHPSHAKVYIIKLPNQTSL